MAPGASTAATPLLKKWTGTLAALRNREMFETKAAASPLFQRTALCEKVGRCNCRWARRTRPLVAARPRRLDGVGATLLRLPVELPFSRAASCTQCFRVYDASVRTASGLRRC